MFKYEGNCSCGETKLVLDTTLKPDEFQPRSDAESCGFCKRHDGVWISDPQGSVRIQDSNATEVETFASRQVKFHFCAKCKDLTYATFSEPVTGKQVAVLRLRLFDSIAKIAKPVITTHFDGENEATGAKRRLANWTPVT